MTSSHSRLRGVQPEAWRVGGTTTGRITQALAAESPGTVVARTGVGKQGQEDFQAGVRAILHDVTAQKEPYLECGLSEGSLEELTRMLTKYEQAGIEENAGSRASTGATAELDVVVRALMRVLQHLDGIALYRYRDKPTSWARGRVRGTSRGRRRCRSGP